MRGSKFEI